ncbi:hypothetical protein ACH42_14775 [Endozoicomonas sp. (ex Bugula neritina AB1)]|nr:hypothetical protein ACH42_14775 [Endozoicomonas sp. (ex Bugula neritina AB1)]
MTLTVTDSGRFTLQGNVTFDNASFVEQQGRDQLALDFDSGVDRFEISFLALGKVDSSALSVCLSWIRLARTYQVNLCFTDVPGELHALATVCGMSEILNSGRDSF